MCQCRNTHIDIYVLSTVHVWQWCGWQQYSKLQANLWRPSMELGCWTNHFRRMRKKKHPPTISWSFFASQLDYPINPWGFRDVYGLGFDSPIIPWVGIVVTSACWSGCILPLSLVARQQATQLRIPVNQPGPRLAFDHRNHRSHYNALRSNDKFWRYLTKTRTSQKHLTTPTYAVNLYISRNT